MPGLLPLGLTLLAWTLLDKKNMKITTVFIIFILIAIVGGLSELLIVALSKYSVTYMNNPAQKLLNGMNAGLFICSSKEWKLCKCYVRIPVH